jgi:hypothetical protein
MKSALLATILLFLLTGCVRKPSVDIQADLDQKFQQMMSGVTLIGHSASLKDESVAGEEKYVIEKVSKLGGETWLFHARIQYGSHDVPVPLPVTMKWAGDTPVITINNLTIPGLGTYTARVLLYQDQYAGTWSSKDHGGQLFGKIVRQR